MVTVDHPLFDWMVEWAAALITRYVKGEDGRGAYTIMRGYEARRDIAEFGENVHYTLLTASHVGLETAHAGGRRIFRGLKFRFGEALIGTSRGVIRATCIKRCDAG